MKMKKTGKILSLLLAAVMILSVIPMGAIPISAKEGIGTTSGTTADGLTYSITLGVATITGYIGTGTSVIIPYSINGCTVKRIGETAFAANTKLTAVMIPATVVYVGADAFSGCKAITSINYLGTKGEWAKITVEDGNEILLNAPITFGCRHRYDDVCDAYCNYCGAERSAPHRYSDATCTSPATCTLCGVTTGSALGHSYADATCTSPATCTVCGMTNGYPLGHTPGDSATCAAPQLCTVCGEAVGKAADHTYDSPIGWCTVCGENSNELPTPVTPNYFVYTDGDERDGSHDELRMIMVTDKEVALLAAEYYADYDAFLEKYGLWSFNVVMQYDVSLDSEEDWQYTEEWDTSAYVGGYASGYQSVSVTTEMMEDFEFFWLVYYEGEDSDTFVPYQPAITTYVYHHEDWDENIYSFDTKNHSLYIRCRYYMEWEPLVQDEEGEGPGEMQYKLSDWSESAVFGKNSTQYIPEEPTVYEAPVISDLVMIEPDYEGGYYTLRYEQTTPESVWMANVYYMMYGNGEFWGLETQISIDGGDWIDIDTYDAWGDWCLLNGTRVAGRDDLAVDMNSTVKLRVRFTGTHGPSEWSNVIDTEEDLIKGDVNCDGVVNSIDSNLLKRAIAGAHTIVSGTPSEWAADMNDDGLIDAIDGNLLKRLVAGK